MPTTYIVRVTGSKWLNANDRRHWTGRHRLTQEWRASAGWAAKNASVPYLRCKVRIEAVLLFPDRRRRDPGNWYPTVKACVDGLVDIHVLADDDDKHLDGPDIRARYEPGQRTPLVELYITAVQDRPLELIIPPPEEGITE